MKYRVILRPNYTIMNNSNEYKYKVQFKLFNLLWISTFDTWDKRESAEQYIKDIRNII